MTRDGSTMNGSNDSNKDVIGILFTSGFAFLGFAIPALGGTLALIRDSSISFDLAGSLSMLAIWLLPGIILVVLQLFACLASLSGVFKTHHTALLLTAILLLYLGVGSIAWVVYEIL